MFKKGPYCPAARLPCFFPTIPSLLSEFKWEVGVWPLCNTGLCFSAMRMVRPLQGQVTGILKAAVTPLLAERSAKSSSLNMNSDKCSLGRRFAAACTAHFPFYLINLLVLTASAVSFHLLNPPMSKYTKPVYSDVSTFEVSCKAATKTPAAISSLCPDILVDT